ncbi:MAG TPA: carboxylesterase family protein [Bryobacteraceae bacterium]|nr:carboxylesterase family protein [Bryobacteraceae bacterium]
MRTYSLVLFAAIASTAAAAAVDEVRVTGGALKGVIAGRVVAFKGIPYAAPPTGRNRWRAPQPVTPWTGVRSAAAYGSDCMQLPFPGDAAPLGVKPAEDCLYLNVWAPVQRPSARLPVMLWIYGGGFVNGGSSPAVYDGTHFAESGVVFVSFNYRVGRFGFFAHPALSREDPDSPLGDYAFLDQIAALKWLRKNIAQFGGDPGNVTLFGESAGGGSVLTMMTTPLARGLFHKAIIESGGGRSVMGPTRRVRESSPNLPSGEAVGIAFARKMGIQGEDAATLAALRALPAERIVDGLNMATMMNPTYAGPMLDTKIGTETPEQALMAGHAMNIPVIVGANSSDLGFSFAKSMDELLAPFGANKKEAQAVYDPEKSGLFRKIGVVVASDRMMVEPARFVVRTIAAAGQRAYEYRFSYVAACMRKQWTGAPHATEIPFVFDTIAARYGKDLIPQDEATAKAALAYWVAFAKTGNPDGRGRPHWPVYNAHDDELMNFTNDGPVAEADPWKTRLDLTETAAQSK